MFFDTCIFLRLRLVTIVCVLVTLTLGDEVSALAKEQKTTDTAEAQKRSAPKPEEAGYANSPVPTERDYRLGSDNAPVVLTLFTDFECPYCQKFHTRMKEVQKNIGTDTLLIAFRNWPLSYHKHSRKIALAARCAGRDNKFWEFSDWAFHNAEQYEGNDEKMAEVFSLESMAKHASSLGADFDAFTKCVKTEAEMGRILRDELDAAKMGGQGTPFILLNGKPYDGNWMKPGEIESAVSKLAN